MGALDNQYPVNANNPERVIQAFTLTFGASGAVASISQGGAGWTFTKTGVGQYSVSFPKAVGVVITTSIFTTGQAQKAFFTARNDAAGTATFVTGTGGALGTTDANAGDRVDFIAVFKFKGVD